MAGKRKSLEKRLKELTKRVEDLERRELPPAIGRQVFTPRRWKMIWDPPWKVPGDPSR